LKPENIVFTQRGYIKLIDLGLAKLVRGYTRTFCGTPHYIGLFFVLLSDRNMFTLSLHSSSWSYSSMCVPILSRFLDIRHHYSWNDYRHSTIRSNRCWIKFKYDWNEFFGCHSIDFKTL